MGKFSLVLAVALSAFALSSGASNKLHPGLASVFANQETADIVVSFADTKSVLNQANFQQFSSRGEKLSFLSLSLQAHAKSSQKKAQAFLASRGIPFRSLWISNSIFIKNAGSELINALAEITEVESIRKEQTLHLITPADAQMASPINILNEWGVDSVSASEAWAAGYEGEGVIVGVIDSGARRTHEALAGKFHEKNGWFDPYPTNTPAPTDSVGHGTHVTGTILGSNGIGVAPKAKYVSCRGCSTSSCTEDALNACGQFMVCPGGGADCSDAPVLVSNSWGGGQGDTFYKKVIDAWHVAGIIPVFAIGNAGPNCGTANSPGDNENVISVGSINDKNTASIFSSKGPSVDGLVKPEVCAPGTAVRSAFHTSDSAYSSLSGTSMATPHVSGVIALMFNANPDLSYDEVLEILTTQNDRDLTRTIRNCGGIDTTKFPNNSYGHGKVNALKAVQAAAALRKA